MERRRMRRNGSLKINKTVIETTGGTYTFTVTPAEGVNITDWNAPSGVSKADGKITATITVPDGETTGNITLSKLPTGVYTVDELILPSLPLPAKELLR